MSDEQRLATLDLDGLATLRWIGFPDDPAPGQLSAKRQEAFASVRQAVIFWGEELDSRAQLMAWLTTATDVEFKAEHLLTLYHRAQQEEFASLAGHRAAMVIWMPDGQQPDATSFFNPGPYNPENHLLEEVFAFASDKGVLNSRPGFKPWLLIGDHVIGPDRIGRLYEAQMRQSSTERGN